LQFLIFGRAVDRMQNLSMGIADRHDAAGLLRKAPRYRKRFSRVCEIKGDQ